MRRSTRIDGSAGGEPLSCGNQSTYNRVANAGNLHRLSPFQMPFGILHNLTGKSSLTFSIEKCHFITAIKVGLWYVYWLPRKGVDTMPKKRANGEGDVCERRQWRMKRAKRSGSRAAGGPEWRPGAAMRQQDESWRVH